MANQKIPPVAQFSLPTSGQQDSPQSNAASPSSMPSVSQFSLPGVQNQPVKNAPGQSIYGGQAPNRSTDFIKGVGNFLFPAVGDIYHDITQGTLNGNGKTLAQQAGDVGSTALGVASLIPGADVIADPIEVGRAAEIAAKTAPSLFSTVGRNAALGAGFGVSGALGSGETDPSQIAQSGVLGAGAGGLLGGAGKLASDKLSSIAGNTAESRLTSQTNRLKTLTKAFNENSRPATASTAATNPITTLVQNGLTKGLKVIDGKVNAERLSNIEGTGSLDSLIDDHSEQASNLVKGMKGGVTLDKYREDVTKAIASNPEIRDAGGVSKATAEINRIFDDYKSSFGEEISYQTIDNIRARMNKVFDPETKDVARTIGDIARSYLYNGDSTNTALRSAMQNESELIKTKNFVQKLHGTTVPGGQLGKYFADLIGAGAGSKIGGMIGGPIGEAAGTVIGGGLTHKIVGGLQSNYFNPLLSGAAGLVKRAVGSTAGKIIGGAAKTGVLRATGQ